MFGNYTSEEVLIVGYQLLGWSALLMLLVGIFSNGFVLLSILYSRHLRIIGYLFSVNLFSTDLIVSVTLFPVLILSLLDFDGISDGTCLVFAFIHSLLTKASQLSIALLAYDRYHSIIHCLRYSKEHADLSYVIKGVCFVWLQALILTTSAVFVADNYDRHGKGKVCIVVPTNTDIFALVMFSLSFCETLFALLFCYSKIICIARQHTRKIAENRRSSNSGNSAFDQQGIIAMTMAHRIPRLTLTPNLLAAQTRHLRQFIGSGSSTTDAPSFGLPNPNQPKQTPARARIVGYVTVFIMCWLPFVVNVFIGAPDDFTTAVTVVLSLFNSVLNPFLYAFASKRYRVKIAKMLERRKRREEVEERRRKELYEEARAKIAVLYRPEEHQSQSDITPVGS